MKMLIVVCVCACFCSVFEAVKMCKKENISCLVQGTAKHLVLHWTEVPLKFLSLAPTMPSS